MLSRYPIFDEYIFCRLSGTLSSPRMTGAPLMIDDDDPPDLLARLDARLADRISTRPTLWQVVQRNRQYLKSKMDEGYTYADLAEALRGEGYLHASAQNVGAAYRANDGKKQVKRQKKITNNSKVGMAVTANRNKMAPSEHRSLEEDEEKILGKRPNLIGKNYFEK